MADNTNKRTLADLKNSESTMSKIVKLGADVDDSTLSSSMLNLDNILCRESDSQILTNKSNEMEKTLICTICQEIMHNCVSIQPCLHSFCALCLLNWKKSGNGCPTCRGDISMVSKNHLVISIVDKFLLQNPDKARPISELEEEDAEVERNKNILFSNDPITIDPTNCRFCNYPGTRFYSQDNSLGYHCTSDTIHVRCFCCQLHIPNIPDTQTIVKNKCQLCNIYSCFLLFQNCAGCEYGCLFTFKDFVLNPALNNTAQVPQFIKDNFFETNVLRNYLNDQKLSVLNMFTECLNKLDNGEMSLTDGIDHNSSLCLECSRKTVLEIVFKYYTSIPKTSLPREIGSRPDCYFGIHCRTQRHRQHHCAKYNHACAQTKF